MSEAFLQMAGVFSQLGLAMIRARVRSGMANARAKGRQTGRPQVGKEDIPATFLRHYPAYKSKQLNVSELARVCDISLSHSLQIHWTFGSIKEQGAVNGSQFVIQLCFFLRFLLRFFSYPLRTRSKEM